MRLSRWARSRALAVWLGMACILPAWGASDQQEAQSLEELRNTVINLLQALVEQGVISKEKAQELVQKAEEKAKAAMAAQAAQKAEQEKQEQGAIRVPYVPEVVRKEIEKEVAQEVRPAVANDVVQEAKTEGWGVPGALPEWIKQVRIFGDITARGQADLYGHMNSNGCPPTALYGNCTVLDYNTINADGGITKAGTNAYLNINQDRWRMRMRARLGALAELDDHWSAVVRLDSGTLTDPSSESQNIGSEFARYPIGLGQMYIRYDARTRSQFDYLNVEVGKFPNPFFSPTELVYQRDNVAFDGLATTGRVGFGQGGPDQSHVFATIGGFPVQEVTLVAKEDKWMVAAQLGTSLTWGAGQRFILAGAFYDFIHVEGVPNPQSIPNSTINNYTAPPFVRNGNSMFDIASSPDGSTNLFALDSRFRIGDISARYVLPLGRYSFAVDAEAARNVGFNQAEILKRTGMNLVGRVNGYVADLSFGDPVVNALWQWKAILGYRYVQRDAVLDSLTDADFHEGGTNAEGYYIVGDLGLGKQVWARLRYMPSKEIDAPIYHVDIWQLDLNARF
jgi:Putative porin